MLNDLLSNFPSMPDRQPSDAWEETRHLVIGSPEGVREAIHELHRRGYAEVGIWSKLLPVPGSDEVMSILTKRRARRRE